MKLIASCAFVFAASHSFGSSAQTFSKIEETSYYDDKSIWVLDQVGRKSINSIESLRITYGSKAMPWTVAVFGKLQQTLTYNTDGTLASVRDGNNNLTVLSSWHRGVPRNIAYADGRTKSASVNDAGWITSTVDENGFATGYSYDAMGRRTRTVYPTADEVAWNSGQASFGPLTSADWLPPGIAVGQWRRVEWTGNARNVTYYDALMRPQLQHIFEADAAGTLTSVRMAYDTEGRLTFQSYPSGEIIPPAQGTWTTYDALGRVTSSSQDSENGLLTTLTEYLPGLRTRVTNPRSQQTVTAYQAYDTPSYEFPVVIDHPEGVRTTITRDVFGKPVELLREATP